jgi:hypothetical protein
MTAMHALLAAWHARKAVKAKQRANAIERDLKALRLKAPEAVALAHRIAHDHANRAATHAMRTRL